MQDYDQQKLFKDFSYLNDPKYSVQAVFVNEATQVLCVILDLKMGDLKDLVSQKGWKCVFDEGVTDDQSLSICITREIA